MFEIVLANGKTLKTDRADEIANFYESDGRTITEDKPRPHKVVKS